ncbi:MAG TPA: relaxase/mobilization nuclease domain-containing protein [Arachidicoccus sp.]
MIGKAKSNISLGKTLAYLQKENSVLFYANNMAGDNLDDYRMQLEDLQQCYRGHGKQLILHAILSPTIEDGQRLDKITWAKMAEMYLREMKLYNDYLSVGFIHHDKEHTHAHLLISKINIHDYKLFQDSFIGKKTQHIADKIAQKFKLTRAMDIKKENLKKELLEKLNKDVNIKTGLRQIEKRKINEEITELKGARQKFKVELQRINEQKFSNSEAYFQQLEKSNFKVIQHFDENSNLRGYSLKKDGTMLSATAIGKEFSLRRLGLLNDNPVINIKNNISTENNNQQQITESIQNINELIRPLTDAKHINSLYNYMKDNGIDNGTLDKSNIQFIEYNNHYYATLKNNCGGYMITNPFTYDHIGKEDVSIIQHSQHTEDIIVCEDIFDYLHHVQNKIKEKKELTNYIVLNNSYDTEKLKPILKQLKPKQIHFSKPLTEDNKNINTLSHERNIFMQQIKTFMDMFFSDEHIYQAPISDFYENKRKKKLKPNW